MRVQVIEFTLSDGRVVTAMVEAFQEVGSPLLTIASCRVFEPLDDPTVVPHVIQPPDPPLVAVTFPSTSPNWGTAEVVSIREPEGAKPNIVYLVTHGSYSDYGIDCVWSSRALAEEFIKTHGDTNAGVEEFILDFVNTSDGRRAYVVDYSYSWKTSPHSSGFYQEHEIDALTVDVREDTGRMSEGETFDRFPAPRDMFWTEVGAVGHIHVLARDKDHAMKIAGDRRAQWVLHNPERIAEGNLAIEEAKERKAKREQAK